MHLKEKNLNYALHREQGQVPGREIRICSGNKIFAWSKQLKRDYKKQLE